MKYCTGQDADKDVFCYTLAGRPRNDSWSLNGQHRRMPLLASDFIYPPNVVEQVCEESCKEKVGGMEMLKGDALEVLEGYYKLNEEALLSSIVFFPSLQNICDGCE